MTDENDVPGLEDKEHDALQGSTSDREQIRQAGKIERRNAAVENADLADVLRSKGGRRLLMKILESCDLNDVGYSQSHATMAFKAGQRNVGLRLLSNINAADPNAYRLMQEEKSLELKLEKVTPKQEGA